MNKKSNKSVQTTICRIANISSPILPNFGEDNSKWFHEYMDKFEECVKVDGEQ